MGGLPGPLDLETATADEAKTAQPEFYSDWVPHSARKLARKPESPGPNGVCGPGERPPNPEAIPLDNP